MPALADRAREVLPSGLTGLAGLACAVLRHPGATTRTQPPDLDRQSTARQPADIPADRRIRADGRRLKLLSVTASASASVLGWHGARATGGSVLARRGQGGCART
jgi:hypothetical protein